MLKLPLVVKAAFEPIKVGLLVLRVFTLVTGFLAPKKQFFVFKTLIKLELPIIYLIVGFRSFGDFLLKIAFELSPALGLTIDLDLISVFSLWFPSFGLNG